MAPNRGRNRAKDFQDALDAPPRDFDPEADDVGDLVDGESADGSDEEEEAHDARDHYVNVGKSKLRQPRTAALGPQYRGSRIARDAMDDEDDDDDPFGGDFVEDSEEDDSEGESLRDDAAMENGMSGSEMSEDEEMPPRTIQRTSQETHAELVKSMAATTSLAQSMQADVDKGRAVKRQKEAFDSLLNSRIKLQKALVGSNTFAGTPHEDLSTQLNTARHALDDAEEAAFALWSSLNALREDMTAARTGEKRKRTPFDPHTPVQELWNHMQAQEQSSIPHRNVTLQRWSAKAQSTTATHENGIINKSAKQATIVDTIQGHLSNRDHLLKRAHTPRSCAPLQVTNGTTEDSKIYDDADFYGLLLTELLERRGVDSIAAANVDLTSSLDLRRAAKTKKSVDTKASKGRKLRYTVHEKLQNFMAPEDRSTWTERQADELFGSLFGRRMGLGEARDDVEFEGGDTAVDGEVLMLFSR